MNLTSEELKLLDYGLRLVRADSIGQIDWARKEPSVAPEGYEDQHRQKILRAMNLIEKLKELA